MPEDVKSKHLEIIKEQVLDLNDKFDFLVTLLIKSNKLGAQRKEKEFDHTEHEFYYNNQNQQQLSSINGDALNT